MASRTLYPPVIASSLPAFMPAKNSTLKVPFSFSKFNNTDDYACAHVTIVKKDTGMNVVNTANDASNNRYRATGIILNVPVLSSTVDGQTEYYIEINSNDLKSKVNGTIGWTPGWYYKIQVRMSAVEYPGSGGQQAWMNANASNFSEWSTVCIIKAIGDISIDVTSFDYNYVESEASSITTQVYGNDLNFLANYTCADASETLAFYRLKLYEYPKSDEPIEDSGNIYTIQNEFNYHFKVESEDTEERYIIEVEYTTINDFNSTFNIDYTLAQYYLDPVGVKIITVDNDETGILKGISSLGEEEDEGRIALKIYSSEDILYSGNLCVRRASSRDNFKVWEKIKIFTFKHTSINETPVWFDYTAESGVWYKYGVQSIDEDGECSKLNQTSAILRNYNFAYLLGENDQQLKLMFDNNIGSFKHQIVESHTDTIGGKYSVFSRNAETNYRTFPLSGLISFWMDEQNTFTSQLVVYQTADIKNMYEEYNLDNNILQYDYIYEREFREKVSEFLYDGKPKLFKSATEGNIIVRLTDVSFSPNQSLNRMIYSFSCTAYELDDNTFENYLKYKFIILKEIESEFFITTRRIGQLTGDFNVTDDIFSLIRAKYNKENVVGYDYSVSSVIDLRIEINTPAMKVLNSGNTYVIGHNIKLNNILITLRGNLNVYEVDPNVTFSSSDTLYLLGDADGAITTINATIDFLYDEVASAHESKKISSRKIKKGLGQIYGSYEEGTSLYQLIYNKYYYDWSKSFRKINRITGIEIEANPGEKFFIQDEDDVEGEEHTINSTGVLVIDDVNNIIQLRYLGSTDGSNEGSAIITYYYILTEGGYK